MILVDLGEDNRQNCILRVNVMNKRSSYNSSKQSGCLKSFPKKYYICHWPYQLI